MFHLLSPSLCRYVPNMCRNSWKSPFIVGGGDHERLTVAANIKLFSGQSTRSSLMQILCLKHGITSFYSIKSIECVLSHSNIEPYGHWTFHRWKNRFYNDCVMRNISDGIYRNSLVFMLLPCVKQVEYKMERQLQRVIMQNLLNRIVMVYYHVGRYLMIIL